MAVVIATIVKFQTDDGLVEMRDKSLVGKTYKVDLATRRRVILLNTLHGIPHEKEIVNTYPPGYGWLVCELLEFGGAPE